jgi:hypothetical protein
MTPTPRVLRRGIAVVAVFLAGIIWVTPQEHVVLLFVYSPDAEDLLEPQIDAFNDAHEGEVEIDGEAMPSGSALTAIVDGTLEPDLWMPAASTWVSLLNLRADAELAPPDNPSFFWSPEVIAIWNEMKEAIEGSQGGRVDWETLVALSTGETTFDELAPGSDLDPFRLGHTKPTRSTSGLFALVSEFMLASDTDVLRVEDVAPDATRNREDVRGIEGSIVHYGDIADDFCPLLAEYRSQYVSATYLQQTTLLRCIDRFQLDLERFISGVVPVGGTYVADYPLVVLQAPWTTERRDDADAFVAWLDEHLTEDDTRSLFFWYGDPWDDQPSVPPTDDVPTEDEMGPPLPLPSAEVLDQVQTAWLDLRKHANIRFVLDRSSAMRDHVALSSSLVCEVIDRLLAEAHGVEAPSQDRVGLDIFGADTERVVPLGPVEEVGGEVCEEASGNQRNEGDVALFDAVDEALSPPIGEEEAIDLVVVIAKGNETASAISKSELRRRIEGFAEQRSPVQVVTVSFDTSFLLGEIADWSRTNPETVTDEDSIEQIASDLAALV